MKTQFHFILLAVLAASFFTPISSASAASFSCMETDRLNASEQRVCKSRSLSALDERLDSWYHRAMKRASYFDFVKELRHEQRHWLRERNSCGGHYWCLRRAYKQRLRVLRNFVEHV